MGVIFQDESNGSNPSMIGYSGATVTTSNHSLIVWSNGSLVTILLQYYIYGDSFVIRFYLIPLMSGQNGKMFS